MKKEITIKWTKRLLAVIATMVWLKIILTISKSSAPFIEQAPYCMVSTMLTFGILTAIYKGLDAWSLKK